MIYTKRQFQEGVTFYTDYFTGNVYDIDIDQDVTELHLSGDKAQHYVIKEVRMYGNEKRFPQIERIYIADSVMSIRIPNKMFPNVKEIISDSKSFQSGNLLIRKALGYAKGVCLFNTFCKRTDELIDLNGVETIADNAFDGCESSNIINAGGIKEVYQNAFYGYEKISDEMKDEELKKLVETIGYKEGLPVVVNPGVLDPKEFIDTVLQVRVPNPFMPDTPQRIATDTSQKLAIRFGETIKAYAASDELDVKDLKLIPLVFAGWLRYLMGVDDSGKAFDLSPDPLLTTVCPYVADLKLEEGQDVESAVSEVLKMKQIFGVDLYEAGLAELVCGYLKEMTKAPGAVRETLKKYV